MKTRLFRWLLIAALFYGGGYLVSARKMEAYVGSMPINDPTWSWTVPVEPTYRFFPAAFWAPIHRLDRGLRPGYWRFTVRAGRGAQAVVVSPAVIGRPVFPRPAGERGDLDGLRCGARERDAQRTTLQGDPGAVDSATPRALTGVPP